jgi:toxin ParE1/3/4
MGGWTTPPRMHHLTYPAQPHPGGPTNGPASGTCCWTGGSRRPTWMSMTRSSRCCETARDSRRQMDEGPRVVLRERARRDVEAAVDWNRSNAGEDTASGFVDALEAALRHVGRYPSSGSARYAVELEIPALRCRKLDRFPYLAFFVERGDHIDVWRVLHGHRDIPAWMRDPSRLLARLATDGPAQRQRPRRLTAVPPGSAASRHLPTCPGQGNGPAVRFPTCCAS